MRRGPLLMFNLQFASEQRLLNSKLIILFYRQILYEHLTYYCEIKSEENIGPEALWYRFKCYLQSILNERDAHKKTKRTLFCYCRLQETHVSWIKNSLNISGRSLRIVCQATTMLFWRKESYLCPSWMIIKRFEVLQVICYISWVKPSYMYMKLSSFHLFVW